MSDLARLILLVILAGGGLTLLGAAATRYMEEPRRIRRALRRVLGAPPEAVLIAPGTGRGTGFSFSSGALATTWDTGAWCLVYGLDDLVGAELVVDGDVLGRVHRGEPRRALDRAPPNARRVTLRMLFDDPAHPDFDLDLWIADAPQRKGGPATVAGAVQEANRWLARAESILRRQVGAAPAAVAARPPPPAPPIAAPPAFQSPKEAPRAGAGAEDDEADEFDPDDEEGPPF
jgi:hypothetical protein